VRGRGVRVKDAGPISELSSAGVAEFYSELQLHLWEAGPPESLQFCSSISFQKGITVSTVRCSAPQYLFECVRACVRACVRE
jgi:hypothetical protein